jgi:hypothetical protein
MAKARALRLQAFLDSSLHDGAHELAREGTWTPDPFWRPISLRMENAILAGFLQSPHRLLAYQQASLVMASGFDPNRLRHLPLYPNLSERAFKENTG